MAANKVLAYLKEREGKEISYEELLNARLAPSPGTLNSDISRLIADSGSGVTWVGQRGRGTRRGVKYNTPVAAVPGSRISLKVIGTTADGNKLAVDEDMCTLIELRLIARLDR